jgi:hypothetical protein
MAVFIEKPPVTSSNCYETMKNAKIAKNHYFPFFPIKTDFKVLQLLNELR